MDNLYISVHIPKTAGTSFKEILHGIAQERLFLDYGDKPLASAYPERKMASLANDADRYKAILSAASVSPDLPVVVHGHFLAAKYQWVFPQAKTLVWLRDPLERLASHYHHWLRNPDLENDTCMKMLNEQMSLVQFARLAPMSNLYSRFLCGRKLESIAFVGITEEFEKGLRLFARILGREPVKLIVNTNANNTGRYPLDKETRQAIMDANKDDMRIYEEAKVVFTQLCRTHDVD